MGETLTFYSSSGNTATISADTYYPSTTDGWVGEYVLDNREWIKGYGWPLPADLPQAQKEEVKDMRGLFQVYVIDPKEEMVIGDILVIAKNEKLAEIKALAKVMPFDEFDFDDLDIVTVKLGNIRAKREIQKVQVVSDE